MNLRIASLEQLRELEKFIDKIGFNPINSIEYGEVASTVDLYTKSFDELVNVVKEFCKKHKIKLNLSTPRILIERDFDRVYELIGTLALQTPKPATIVVNNDDTGPLPHTLVIVFKLDKGASVAYRRPYRTMPIATEAGSYG